MTTEFSWRAVFINGPCAGSADRVFAVGPPWAEMRLAPIRPDPHGWTIVGGDGIPELDDAPARVPWTGEVAYRLVSTGPDPAGEDELVAEYGYVSPGPRVEDVYPPPPGGVGYRYHGD